jgi:hypothetical protein
MISYQSNKVPRETTMLGQDLYSVYSNYSYSCNVSMMGDAQITPLMYFQLNNIAMWKGAYLITNVHHDISVRGMETQFTGIRQARPSVPLKDDKLDVPAGEAPGMTPYSQGDTKELGSHEESLDISQRPLDRVEVDKVKAAIFTINRDSLNKSENGDVLTTVNGTLTVSVYYEDSGSSEDFEVAKTIEGTHAGDENERKAIQNFDVANAMVYFSLPHGRYGKISLEDPPVDLEYRDDSFYDFTDGKHIMITDSRLHGKSSEIITGETNLDRFKVGGLMNTCIGNASPIMLYSESGKNDENRAVYQEVFNFVKRMNEAGKLLSMLIKEPDNLLDIKVE